MNMKKLSLLFLVFSVFVLAGCQNNQTNVNKKNTENVLNSKQENSLKKALQTGEAEKVKEVLNNISKEKITEGQEKFKQINSLDLPAYFPDSLVYNSQNGEVKIIDDSSREEVDRYFINLVFRTNDSLETVISFYKNLNLDEQWAKIEKDQTESGAIFEFINLNQGYYCDLNIYNGPMSDNLTDIGFSCSKVK